jgi:hypothetical protein
VGFYVHFDAGVYLFAVRTIGRNVRNANTGKEEINTDNKYRSQLPAIITAKDYR